MQIAVDTIILIQFRHLQYFITTPAVLANPLQESTELFIRRLLR